MQKTFACLLVLALLSFRLSLAQSKFPAIQQTQKPAGVSAPGESFNPPVDGGTASETPQVAEWTKTAGPDESIVLTGHNLTRYAGKYEGKDTRFAVYGPNGIKNVAIQRIDGNKAIVTLPAELSRWGMYLLWAGNNNGYGRPIAINKTEAWWVGPDKAFRGGTIAVYGRNLSNGNGTYTSNVFIESEQGGGQWAKVVKVNPYRVDFVVPSNLSNGNYKVWVHNGHGGEYGWSEPVDLIVVDSPKWTGVVYNVKDYGATGNGYNNDRDAINRALVAAGASGATVYFPAGTYMVSGSLDISSNSKLEGEKDGNGNPASTIKLAPGYQPGPFGLMGGYSKFSWPVPNSWFLQNIVVSNLKFDRNNQYTGETFMNFRHSEFIWFNNCEIYSPGSTAAMRFMWGSHIFLNRVKMTAGKDQWGETFYIVGMRQMFIDGCTFQMTRDCGAAIMNRGIKEVSVTNSVFRDLDNTTSDGSGWGKGRIWASIGAEGAQYHQYFAGNKGQGLGTRQSGWNLPDKNSGEIMLWEANLSMYDGYATGATENTVTVTGTVPTKENSNARPAELAMVIVAGKGRGQYRVIKSRSGNTLKVDQPWGVLPDGTSHILIGPFVEKVVLYQNEYDANGKDYIAKGNWMEATASAGVQPYGGCFDFVIDGNTFRGLRRGISIWATDHGRVDPSYFHLSQNNKVLNCDLGIYHGSHGQENNEISLLGIVHRRNVVDQSISSGIQNDTKYNASPVFSDFIYEHNRITNSPAAFQTGDMRQQNPALDYGWTAWTNQVFYKNYFSGQGSAIRFTPKLVVRNNNYQGFSSIYKGGFEPIIEAPQHVVEMNASESGQVVRSNFVFFNSGTESMDWSAQSSTNWLTFGNNDGQVKHENEAGSIELIANTAGLGTGTHTADIIIQAGGKTAVYQVLLTIGKNAPVNNAPTVMLTSPVSSGNYVSGSSIQFSATASDDGDVSKVEFYQGSTKLGEDLSEPYEFSWKNAPAGSYVITARAYDQTGLWAKSQGVTINIKEEDAVSTPTAPQAPAAAVEQCSGTGSISVEVWVSNSGTIDFSPVNYQAPIHSGTLPSFSTPVNGGDNYICRTRGFICPPQSGNYTFFFAADDVGKLFLSTDANPGNKKEIASVNSWTAPGQFNKYGSQRSATIYLQAGTKYFIEGIYQEQTGGDHMSVGWQLPNGTSEFPISGKHLIPYGATSIKSSSALNATAFNLNGSLAMQFPEATELVNAGLNISPNPVVQSGTIRFSTEGSDRTVLELYNNQGALVQKLFDGITEAGKGYQVTLDASRLTPGVYFCRMVTGKTIQQKQVVVMKN